MVGEFKLDRKVVKLTDKEKFELYPGGFDKDPPSLRKAMKESYPNSLTYFEKIFVDKNGYIFVMPNFTLKLDQRDFDVFDKTGKYIYKSQLVVPEGYRLVTYLFKKDFLFLALEDEEGEFKVVKYTYNLD